MSSKLRLTACRLYKDHPLARTFVRACSMSPMTPELMDSLANAFANELAESAMFKTDASPVIPALDLTKIGDSTAEKIKKEIGTAIPSNNNTYAVKGRDLRSGTPKEVNITEEDTAEALDGILREMVNGIKDALEATPPELSGYCSSATLCNN